MKGELANSAIATYFTNYLDSHNQMQLHDEK